ncbi:MAG: hypothetical protein IKM83_06840 [Paludibacteraceae bacterium]|nr:hypothetical protein [Paludibacteraceae bacterium]
MATKKQIAIKQLDDYDYRIEIPRNQNVGILILHLERKVNDVKVVSVDFNEKADIIDVNLVNEARDYTVDEAKDFLFREVCNVFPGLLETPVQNKDIELYEAINEKATEFYERDEENHAVFLLLMDKKTEHINGCILGERNNIMSGIAHSLRRDDKLLMDIAEVTQALLLEGAIDALNEIKDKSKK